MWLPDCLEKILAGTVRHKTTAKSTTWQTGSRRMCYQIYCMHWWAARKHTEAALPLNQPVQGSNCLNLLSLYMAGEHLRPIHYINRVGIRPSSINAWTRSHQGSTVTAMRQHWLEIWPSCCCYWKHHYQRQGCAWQHKYNTARMLSHTR